MKNLTLNKILNHIKINRDTFENEMKKLRTGKEWEQFIEKWFKVSKWPRKNYIEVFDELEKRKPFKKACFKWYPFSRTTKIPPELAFEYERALDILRNKLDPKMHRRLYARKEGRACAYCSIYAKSTKPKKCPVCGRQLFYTRITED